MNTITITEENGTTVVKISNKDEIENSVYWSSSKGFNTAFDSNGNKICNFNLVGNHSIAMINRLAGIEVRKDNDPAFGWGIPQDSDPVLAFFNDGHGYYQFIKRG